MNEIGDWREREALHRYGVVRELADERLSARERGRAVRAAARALHPHPSGELRSHARSTIDRWIRAYLAGGFEALKPRLRTSGPLTDPEILAEAASLRREEPARTGAQIAAILRELHGEAAPSPRTVQRHLVREGLRGAGADGDRRGLGRFEASAPNELWVADALHGPVVATERGGSVRRKAICFAVLDDHSRLLCAARFEPAETELRLERVLRTALEARGVPARLYVDNGAPFASGQLARICAHLGIRLIHSKPGRPEGRGKVERLFRTLRSQFLVEATRREELSLPDLNRMLDAWLERVYHRRAHSETGQAPIERFTSGAAPRYASAEELHDAFLWAERRVVSRSATVSLEGNRYEVDPVLRGRTVELRYDPYAIGAIEVRHGGRSFGEAIAHELSRHVHPRAEAELALEAPSPSGIDYLAMVETAHERELARRISYREIDSARAAGEGEPDGAAAPDAGRARDDEDGEPSR